MHNIINKSENRKITKKCVFYAKIIHKKRKKLKKKFKRFTEIRLVDVSSHFTHLGALNY